jgi:glycosyltransferase involved in cell wall biosynthesis
MKNICLVTQNAYFLEVFLVEQIKALKQNYRVYLILDADPAEIQRLVGSDVVFIRIAISRNIAIFKDLRSLFQLLRVFLRVDFLTVHSTTPKAGLVAMTAAFLARIPNRMHTFTGQVWQTKRGFSRLLLKMTDRLTSLFATKILVDSFSQLDNLVASHITSRAKASVLGSGSICGVDTDRFRPNDHWKREIRAQLGIPTDAQIVLYMARLTIDKGARDMAYAFELYKRMAHDDAYLVMVGPDEEDLSPVLKEILSAHEQKFKLVGYTRAPEKFFAAADVFCLPSYREGFPMVLLNAASSSVPAIASRIYGSTDGIEEGTTGYFHNAGDHQELAHKIQLLLSNAPLRARMGGAARSRVVAEFSKDRVTTEMVCLFDHLAASTK